MWNQRGRPWPTQSYPNIRNSSPVSARSVVGGGGYYAQGSTGGPGGPTGPGASSTGSAGTGSAATASGSSAMNSGAAGGPGAGVVAADASNVNITIMNIMPPVPVPVPGGLRFVHPYLPPPPTPASSPSVNRALPPPGPPTAYNRDAYRNATPNVVSILAIPSYICVNERAAISVSSSTVPQVGVGVSVGAGGEYVVSGREPRQRISLLPAPAPVTPSASPTAPDYHAAAAAAAVRNIRTMMPIQQEYRPGPTEMASIQEAPPFKKIRLGQQPNQAQTQQQQQQQQQPQSQCQPITPADACVKQKHVQQLQTPLRIDTRPVQGAYTPKVEAISPTLPEPSTQEDAQFRSIKDDLLQQISRVDREIAKKESQISQLRKTMKELEETANKPLDAGGLKNVEEAAQPKHQSLAQKIYAENRKKAEEAHRLLDRLGPKVELPLYNQPSDIQVYQENRTRHQTCLRKRLVLKLRRDHGDRASTHGQQSQTYAILVQEWHRKVEKLEATQKRKTKEAKNREFFEKVFPELRKQREDKERFNRVGARIKSEADLEEIMDGLQEQEMEDKKMRSYAVIPPLLLDAKQRRIAFQNRNGLLQPEEVETLHNERKQINIWSSLEHNLFKEKYLQHPKNFGAIAQSFEHKSVPDCVHHYYLTKKAENYKQLLRKSRRIRSSRNNPNNKVNNSNSTIGPLDILTTGVTTRLQREQQQKTQENLQSNLSSSNANSNPSVSSVTAPTAVASVATTVVTSSPASAITSSTTAVESANTTAETTTITTTITTTATTTPSITSTTPPASAPSTTVTSASTLSTTTASPTSATTTTTTTTTLASAAKDAREANKENKEIKTERMDYAMVYMKNIKEDLQSSSDATVNRDAKTTPIHVISDEEGNQFDEMEWLQRVFSRQYKDVAFTPCRMDAKGTLSSSSNTSTTNASLQSETKDKKKTTVAGSTTTGVRVKDKKKENHTTPTPMETSDEEAQSTDTIGLKRHSEINRTKRR